MRVETDEETYCLKPVRKSQSRLEFMHDVQEHVRKRGFDRVQPLLRTTSGSIAVWRRGVAWTLTPWVEGRELSYDRLDEVTAAAAVLARFHLAVAAFISPAGSRWQSNLGKWPAKVASRCAELLAAARTDPGGDRTFASHLSQLAPTLAAHTRRSLLALSSPAYRRLCQAEGGHAPVCHGDPAAHNFLVGANGRVEMIDLNSLRIDLPCVDLWKLLRRVAFHLDWEPDAVLALLGAYNSVRPVGPEERDVLLGLLWFPEKHWRLVVEASKARVDWTVSRERGCPSPLALEVCRAGRQLPAKERCLEMMADRL
ncbi:MAG: CotS family spore coat protein [Bacillota bacterium]|nr:CotS family spore coat protein [Bacillota bacterium]